MDKLTPKPHHHAKSTAATKSFKNPSNEGSKIAIRAQTTAGRDALDRIGPHQSRTSERGYRSVSATPKRKSFKMVDSPKPSGPVAPQQRAIALEPNFKPSKANSKRLIQEQATAPLPPSLKDIPKYRHIWVSEQFELYDRVDVDLRKKFDEDPNLIWETVPCERLGRHLIFNCFPLVRDFITSDKVRAQKEFQDREGLALEVAEKLYGFALNKTKARTFTREDFVQLNLLLAVLVDWRKGTLTSLTPSDRLKEELSGFFIKNKIYGNENLKYFNLSFIFKQMNETLANSENHDSLQNIVNNVLFYQDKYKDAVKVPSELIAYQDASSRIADAIQKSRFDNSSSLHIAYTDCSSGIAESHYIKDFLQSKNIIRTTFDCSLGLPVAPGKKDAQRYIDGKYMPHEGRLSTATNIDHDGNHPYNMSQFFSSNLLESKFPFKSILEKLMNENAKGAKSKIIEKLLFFLTHEAGNLAPVEIKAYPKCIIRQSTGWEKIFPNWRQRTGIKTKKDFLKIVISNAQTQLSQIYSWANYHLIYNYLYRDLELMLHEGAHQVKDNACEKQFTHKPLKDKDGKSAIDLIPKLTEEQCDSARPNITPKDLEIAQEANRDPSLSLRQKWKAIPKGLRNIAKSLALQDGYKRFFDTALAIVEAMPEEALETPRLEAER
jgi:hypothetical protein